MNETVYHITVLSNFARGYDKYRRVYAKTGIPESTYPDRFFVLQADELGIGVRKATELLTKLGIPGNRLIACAFLRSARRALLPDGRLIIDVFNHDPAKLSRSASERYLHKTITAPSGESIRVETASHYRADTQILHFDLFYLIGSSLLRTKSVNMRCFFPEELLVLCQFNGLEVINRYGNYDEGPFISESPKQILVCRCPPVVPQ
jgi:hypothetical protein